MKAGCRVLDKAGCRTKSRQDVAAHLFPKNKTATLLSLSPLACHEAACRGLAKRRSIKISGRRGSNSRQPAWKAGTLPLSYSRIVGVHRLELWTSWSQTRRATNCATPRLIRLNYIILLPLCQVPFLTDEDRRHFIPRLPTSAFVIAHLEHEQIPTGPERVERAST